MRLSSSDFIYCLSQVLAQFTRGVQRLRELPSHYLFLHMNYSYTTGQQIRRYVDTFINDGTNCNSNRSLSVTGRGEEDYFTMLTGVVDIFRAATKWIIGGM